ncbi:helix-turn-helix domain-containing protein [Bifidobacterium pullorum]|uniref:helix-turn-helix domain-containing protein n=1 Tax=Bifidobacterium pullorum TaxID=78448 RepID=UPI000A67CA04|nr:helix-turn-helix domain-containing protein [Bifidobacterium pullorum]
MRNEQRRQWPRTAVHPNRAATRLGIPVSTLARWRSERRELPYVTVGRLIRYRQSDLDRWIEDNTVYPEK